MEKLGFASVIVLIVSVIMILLHANGKFDAKAQTQTNNQIKFIGNDPSVGCGSWSTCLVCFEKKSEIHCHWVNK